MKRGDIDFQYANNVVAVKWFDNSGVTIVGTFLEECNKVSTVRCKVKGQSAKITIPCPKVFKITTLVLVVLISLIKKQLQNQLLTNWTASYLMGIITLDYFLI